MVHCVVTDLCGGIEAEAALALRLQRRPANDPALGDSSCDPTLCTVAPTSYRAMTCMFQR
jgi:hypothetical protein